MSGPLSFISNHLSPIPSVTGYANWHSGEVESLVPVGSSPTSVTENTIPWSNGKDAWANYTPFVNKCVTDSLARRLQLYRKCNVACRCYAADKCKQDQEQPCVSA